MQQELLHWYNIITKQNYFTTNNEIIIQQDGLAMGAPSSGLIAEIFLQHMEHLHLAHLTHRHRIINYWRYVGDILTPTTQIYRQSFTTSMPYTQNYSSRQKQKETTL